MDCKKMIRRCFRDFSVEIFKIVSQKRKIAIYCLSSGIGREHLLRQCYSRHVGKSTCFSCETGFKFERWICATNCWPLVLSTYSVLTGKGLPQRIFPKTFHSDFCDIVSHVQTCLLSCLAGGRLYTKMLCRCCQTKWSSRAVSFFRYLFLSRGLVRSEPFFCLITQFENIHAIFQKTFAWSRKFEKDCNHIPKLSHNFLLFKRAFLGLYKLFWRIIGVAVCYLTSR